MPTLTYQPSILDVDDQPVLGDLSASLRRHQLAHGAWIDVLPGWVAGSADVFETLLTRVPWRAERRQMYDSQVNVPRLLCWYADNQSLPHPALTAARGALDRHYLAQLGEPFATAGLCLYRDGRDSVAWHGDTNGRSARQDTMVAIVSFGSPRALLLRPRTYPGERAGPSQRFMLGHGDLAVMGGSCQRTWEHAVPKTARPVGPRVSVQFRPAGVA